MINPDELGKMFPSGLPDWVESISIGKKEKKDNLVAPVKETVLASEDFGLVYVRANLGVVGPYRMFCFWKNDVVINPSEERPFQIALSTVDDMKALGLYPGIKSEKFQSTRVFATEGKVNENTILKVFVGYIGQPTWGAAYFQADTQGLPITLSHPECPGLYLSGRFTLIEKERYPDFGLRAMRNQDGLSPAMTPYVESPS